ACGRGHRSIESGVHVLVLIGQECPAVHSVLDQFQDRLAVKASQHRQTRRQRLVHDDSPFVAKRWKNEDASLAVEFGQLLVGNAPKKAQLNLRRKGKALELQPLRTIPRNPELAIEAGMVVSPIR